MKYMNFSSLNISEKVNESYVTFLEDLMVYFLIPVPPKIIFTIWR